MNEFLLGHKEVENKVFDVVHIERIPVEFLNVFTHLINVMKLLKVFGNVHFFTLNLVLE